MKKTYQTPAIMVVSIHPDMQLLTSSLTFDKYTDDEVQDPDEII